MGFLGARDRVTERSATDLDTGMAGSRIEMIDTCQRRSRDPLLSEYVSSVIFIFNISH